MERKAGRYVHVTGAILGKIKQYFMSEERNTHRECFPSSS